MTRVVRIALVAVMLMLLTSVGGCGHALVSSDEEGIDFAKRYLSYFPGSFADDPPGAPPSEPAVARFADRRRLKCHKMMLLLLRMARFCRNIRPTGGCTLNVIIASLL